VLQHHHGPKQWCKCTAARRIGLHRRGQLLDRQVSKVKAEFTFSSRNDLSFLPSNPTLLVSWNPKERGRGDILSPRARFAAKTVFWIALTQSVKRVPNVCHLHRIGMNSDRPDRQFKLSRQRFLAPTTSAPLRT
jgi:hypothetical protein